MVNPGSVWTAVRRHRSGFAGRHRMVADAWIPSVSRHPWALGDRIFRSGIPTRERFSHPDSPIHGEWPNSLGQRHGPANSGGTGTGIGGTRFPEQLPAAAHVKVDGNVFSENAPSYPS